MNQDKNKSSIKTFIIKLIAISFSIIVVVSMIYNLIFAESMEKINKFLTLTNKENIEIAKDKIRFEIKKGLKKEKLFNDKDKVLLYKFYLKVKDEFKDLE